LLIADCRSPIEDLASRRDAVMGCSSIGNRQSAIANHRISSPAKYPRLALTTSPSAFTRTSIDRHARAAPGATGAGM